VEILDAADVLQVLQEVLREAKRLVHNIAFSNEAGATFLDYVLYENRLLFSHFCTHTSIAAMMSTLQDRLLSSSDVLRR
jgi:hypothetical protein